MIVLALSCLVQPVKAQNSSLEFVENKGQWNDMVTYKGDLTAGAFFLTKKGFRIALHNTGDMEQLTDFYHGTIKANLKSGQSSAAAVVVHSHAYDVSFANAGTPKVVPEKMQESYNNYFLGSNPDKWRGQCRIFQAITYRDMYPGIDVRYYTDNGRLKYDIIVKPGADISKLALRYEGADELFVKKEQLNIRTSVGLVSEMPPYAFQVINGTKQEVNCRYRVSGNTVFYQLDNYDKSSTLVIDPTLVFSTLTGSTSDNWGYTATYGTDGSFYAGGIVFGSGFPVNTGAYQTTFGGGVIEGQIDGYDVGIIKFNPTGTTRVYATYIGGTANEQPHSLVADASGNLIIGGRTNSSDFPLQNGTLVGPGGAYDIFLAKLNAAGTALIGSRRIGGSQNDGANVGPKYVAPLGEVSIRRNYGDDARSEVLIDAGGNILLASNTQSTDFPLQSPFQPTFGGAQDGVIIRASADLSSILVSSFLGGTGDDAAFVLAVNPINGSVYVGGNTTSTNLPGDTTGVLYPRQNGNTDGFVSILSPNATALLKTTYMGTSSFDMLYGIQFDRFGFPYIMGTTLGAWPVRNAPFSEAGGKQFICKLQADLSAFVYSTIFGTNTPNPNISPIAFLVDRCENVYVSGWGGQVDNATGFSSAGTANLPVTADAIQKVTDGSDFYFFVLERNARSRLYASFFGQNGSTGEHVDGGTSRFDKDGVIYQALCANCGGGATFPTTPGVWSRINGSSNCNLAAVKIAFNLSGIANSIKSSISGSTYDTVGCVPLRVDFRDTLAEGKKYIWIFGDGKRDTTTTASISHVFNSVGFYTVTLVSIDSSKCNIADTARTFINVKTFKAFVDFDWQKQPPCDSFKYKFFNLSTVVPAARPFASTSFTWNFGDGSPEVVAGRDTVMHSFPAAGTYTIRLRLTDTNFCNAPVDTTRVLRIANIVTAKIDGEASGCTPFKATFINNTIAGETFLWNFGDNSPLSTEENPVHVYTVPGVYKVTLIATNVAACNRTDTTTFIVTVRQSPTAGFFVTPSPPVENTPISFFNTSLNAEWFLWKFGDGDSLFRNTMETVQHTYNKTFVYRACLNAYNRSGCWDSVCIPVAAKVLPLLDVPNAFTPNNDGINDKVFVRGFGIAKMLWRIYNRWGVLVYESADKNEGWDGRYKGSLQPMEVYHYTLDVIYSDNSTFQKKGDITLIR